jgi:hypothetical protein
MLLKFFGLIAVVSVAMCLVPAGAHFFELANKMSMSQRDYMIVQKIYAGWSFFGIAVIAALLLTLIHTFMVRSESHGLFSLVCCVPLSSRHAGDLLDVHIPNERSKQQLDSHTGRLRGGAAAVGVFACRQRHCDLCGVGRHHRFSDHPQA